MLFDNKNKKDPFLQDKINDILKEDNILIEDEDFGFNSINESENIEEILPLSESVNDITDVDKYNKPETYIECFIKEPIKSEEDLYTEMYKSMENEIDESHRVMNFIVKEEETKMFTEKFDTFRAIAMDMYAIKLLGECVKVDTWKEKYFVRQFEFMLESINMPNLKKQWIRDINETTKMVKEAVVAAYSAGGPQANREKYSKYLAVQGSLADAAVFRKQMIEDRTDMDI